MTRRSRHMTAFDAYAQLVHRGCLCGTDRIAACPIHPTSGDYRGLRAYFKAGMPKGFPMPARCALCGGESLIYPSVALDRGEVPAGEAPHPTLVCPSCSRPRQEESLRAECEEAGYDLNDQRVFERAVAA